jgi:hypothetical protein
MKTIPIQHLLALASNHPDFHLFASKEKKVNYLGKSLKRGPSFPLKLKNLAAEFCSLNCRDLVHLIVERETYLTIWFESREQGIGNREQGTDKSVNSYSSSVNSQ